MHTNTIETATTTVDSPKGTPAGLDRGLLMAGAKATGLGVVAVMATYLVAVGVGQDLLVAGPDGTAMEVTTGSIFGMTVLGGTIAVALAWAFGRWSARPRLTFLATTVVGVVAYAAVPFAAAESVASALWLNGMHLAVAIPVLTILARRLPRERT